MSRRLHAVAVVAVAAMLAFADAATTHATTRADFASGVITFAVSWPLGLSGPTGPNDFAEVVCGVDSAGHGYRLTPVVAGALFWEPNWSSDGSRLALAARGSFDSNIGVVTPPSLTMRGAVAHASWPSWSPDGSKLAFQTPPDFTESRPREIWIADVNGQEQRRVAAGSGRASWSPDGSRLVVASGGDIRIVDVAAGTTVSVASGPELEQTPDWSPDGMSIVFVSGTTSPHTIEVVGADGTDRRVIGRGEFPVWSPTGEEVAFVREGSVYVMRPDGTGERLVRPIDAHPSGGLDWQPVARPETLASLPPCIIRGDGRLVLAGSRFDDAIMATNAAERISSGAGNDVVFAFGGNDAVAAGIGRDKISGGSGSDRLDGGTGSDVLHGDAGPDRLIGGRGSDFLSAGSGNDAILARDGERDTIMCGAGRDIVEADSRDRIARDCERVNRP